MNWFDKQIQNNNTITKEVIEKVEYRVVWSGKIINIGDKVLYAFVFDMKDDGLKLTSFLERELDEVYKTFDFVGLTNDIIPVLKFKQDNKKREI